MPVASVNVIVSLNTVPDGVPAGRVNEYVTSPGACSVAGVSVPSCARNVIGATPVTANVDVTVCPAAPLRTRGPPPLGGSSSAIEIAVVFVTDTDSGHNAGLIVSAIPTSNDSVGSPTESLTMTTVNCCSTVPAVAARFNENDVLSVW